MDEHEDLIAKIKDRDGNALAVYIEAHRNQLSGFVKSITSNRLLSVVELDDILQDISATALQSLPTAPLADYTPMQWLQQLARRRVVDSHRYHFDAQRRNAGRQQSIHAPADGAAENVGLEQLLAASMTSPSAVVSQNIRLSRMQQAIGELGEDQREAIRLRFVEGLSTKEIAEKLNKTDVAIRVLLSRSMRQLESMLTDVRPTR